MVVYAKPGFGSPDQVLAYLGRYTHRVAIANSRLIGLDKGPLPSAHPAGWLPSHPPLWLPGQWPSPCQARPLSRASRCAVSGAATRTRRGRANATILKNNLLVLLVLNPIVFLGPLGPGAALAAHGVPPSLGLLIADLVSAQFLGWLLAPAIFRAFAW